MVTLVFGDLRPVCGVALPFTVDFLHDGEKHTYRFRSVLPFRLAPGEALATEPALAAARLNDLAEIVALHERALQAHRDGDVGMLIADEAPESVHSTRGRLQLRTREDLQERLGPYLESTRFERYLDVVAPVVAVSADGSLGWLACEVEAVGERREDSGRTEPVAFGFSWVEMLAHRDGRWMRVGTASSPRP